MIGVDTNVLVRLFIDDDHSQHRRATRFYADRSTASPAFISLIAVVEFAWVMKRTYKRKPNEILAILSNVIASEDAVVESAEEVSSAIAIARDTGADLSDVLIARATQRGGGTTTVTFDEPASRLVPGMEMLK